MPIFRRIIPSFLAALVWLSLSDSRVHAAPSGVVVDGVPDIPIPVEQATARYFSATSNSFMDWDPKTGAMLISAVDVETQQLHLLSEPQGQKSSVTVFPDIISSGSFMPKLGDLVIFGADHLGDEFYQLYSLNLSTGTTHLLTDGQSLNKEVIYGHSGLQIAYRSTARKGKDPDIYVMDPRDSTSAHLLMEIKDGGWALQDWAHDDHRILVSHCRSLTVGYLWSVDTITGETTLLTKDLNTQLPYAIARYAPDDSGIYVVSLGSDLSSKLQWLPLTPQAKSPAIPEGANNIEDIRLSPDGSLMAYLKDADSGNELHIFDTVTGVEKTAPSLTKGVFHRLRWNAAGTELGFSFSTTEAPSQAYSYTPESGVLQQWTKGTTLAPGVSVIKPELVKISSFDQLAISGYLYRPDPRKFPGKRPVLVSIHGGPAMDFKPHYLGGLNYYLNELGVALLFPNVRGSTGFGERFTELDNGFKREDSVKDIGAFLDWIQSDPGLDSDRIGVEGASYGGYMTLATLYHYNNRIRCGSDSVGITDFVTFLRNTSPYRQANRRYEYGDERYPEMNKFLESISPLNHVAEILDPLMITAGKNDPRVPESESDQMVNAMRAQKGIVWYVLGENEGHGFHRRSDALYQFAAEAYFFETYLLPLKRLTPLLATPPQAAPLRNGPD